MFDKVTLKLNVDPLILGALKEDITSEDVSTNSVMPEPKLGEVELICKQFFINFRFVSIKVSIEKSALCLNGATYMVSPRSTLSKYFIVSSISLPRYNKSLPIRLKRRIYFG